MHTLNALHDKEVASLMKRLENQNKEELLAIGKAHKDKNEMARIKRELQQKLIDQAVVERQRFKSLLDKRLMELTNQHEEVKKKVDEEKSAWLARKRKECEERCEQLRKSYQHDPGLFVHSYLSGR